MATEFIAVIFSVIVYGHHLVNTNRLSWVTEFAAEFLETRGDLHGMGF